jgi:hypothetical protein
MAGHSKWANIKHRKERSDKKKGKIFSRIMKEIISAVKQGGPDIKTNSKHGCPKGQRRQPSKRQRRKKYQESGEL